MSSTTIRALCAVGLTLATAAVATSTEASARNGRNAALFGGLAAGAIAGGVIANGNRAFAAPVYGAPAYGYYGALTYYAAPAYVRSCYRERQPVYDDWGDLAGYRVVRVCD
ncbi:hypothetical protein [Alsobacter sp. SYSU BS001988]